MSRQLLDEALDGVFGGPPVDRRGPPASDEDPLADIVVHRHPSGHLHLATYGLTELDAKTSPDPDFSGRGFEITLRWAGPLRPTLFGLLEGVAAYLVDTGRFLNDGDHLLMRSSLEADLPGFAGLLVLADPELPARTGPFGYVEWLQLLAVHDDELFACRTGRLTEMRHRFRKHEPLLVNRPDRPSVLGLPL